VVEEQHCAALLCCDPQQLPAILGSCHEASDQSITLWLFNIAMENDPFVDDFPS